MMYISLRVILGLLYLLVLAKSQRTKDKMYSNLAGAACFKRLNGTHATGCTSDFGGSKGALHLISSDEDINFLLKDPPSPPYIPIIFPQFFTRENILKIKSKGKNVINGILLINNRTSLKTFSEESKCPNQYGGLKEQTCDANKIDTTWNPFGTDLLNEDFDFPIYYVSKIDEINKLINCFNKFNNFDISGQPSRSLCSVEIQTLMSAAGSSETCIRRSNSIRNLTPTKYCDPLQGKNIYGTLFERKTIDPADNQTVDLTEKFILVTTRIDTSSLFDNHYIGAMGNLVSYATLIGIGQFLNAVLPERQANVKYNILFVLFNGESFDYIGSQSLVYDMQNKEFPLQKTLRNLITLDNIELMIDIGTLDDFNSINVYHLNEFEHAKTVLNTINAYNEALGWNITATDKLQKDLPPFSAQTFLRDNDSFPALILSSSPQNRFYHSVFDDAINLNFTYLNHSTSDFMELQDITVESSKKDIQYRIRNLSTLLGITLYDFITGTHYSSKMGVNVALIDEFLYCTLISSNCTLFKAVESDDSYIPDIPFNRYIGVNTGDDATIFAYKIMGFVLGKKTNQTKDECKNFPYIWYNGVHGNSECKLTTHNRTYAISPAFTQDDYNWTSYRYSTWTESTWTEITARIYLRPSKIHEAFTLAVGLIVMTISFVIVFLMNSRSDILFADSTSTTPIAPPANC